MCIRDRCKINAYKDLPLPSEGAETPLNSQPKNRDEVNVVSVSKAKESKKRFDSKSQEARAIYAAGLKIVGNEQPVIEAINYNLRSNKKDQSSYNLRSRKKSRSSLHLFL